MKYRFLFEISATPVYQRIISAFATALKEKGHEVRVFEFGNRKLPELIRQINNLKADFCVITNPHGLFGHFSENRNKFVYEMIKAHLVFIHHDNFFGSIFYENDIQRRFQGFQKVADRSTHFCIEESNIEDLFKLSIPNAWKIFHASEFTKINSITDYQYDVSFVGHVLPDMGVPDWLNKTPLLSQKLTHDFDKRSEILTYSIGDSAALYAEKVLPANASAMDWAVAKQTYIGLLHNISLRFRGRILAGVGSKHQIHIFGGDPAYLQGEKGTMTIDSDSLTYHPPTQNDHVTRDVYTRSKININITSLQFDTALINRVMDVGAVGGLVLTDYRKDLAEITISDQISYRNIDELRDKIDDFLSHDHRRNEVAAQLQKEVREKFSYDRLLNVMIAKLANDTTN